jgi:quinol monooxygenase YgiN
MTSRRFRFAALLVAVTLLGATVYAQVTRPYRNGSVWSIAFIRVKPGMNEAYMSYLTGQWKATQEAMKKEGLILSYKVVGTEGHSPTDWNLMLITEYKDMATMEANEQKEEAVSQKVVGDDQKMMQGYRDRSEIREVMGERLAREIVLEPRQ